MPARARFGRAWRLAALLLPLLGGARAAPAVQCADCVVVEGCAVCGTRRVTEGCGFKYCQVGVGCARSCTLLDPTGCAMESGGVGRRLGRIGFYTVDSGAAAGLPTVATPASSSVADVKARIAAVVGGPPEAVRLRAAGFMVAPAAAAWATTGWDLGAGAGVTFAADESDGYLAVRACQHAAGSSVRRAYFVVQHGQALLVPVTVGSLQFVVALHAEDVSDETWEAAFDKVQEEHSADVAAHLWNEVEVRIPAPDSLPACE